MVYKYGIDFGTTNSSISLRVRDEVDGKENTIVFDVKDTKPFETLPSVIYVDENRRILVGADAKKEFRKENNLEKELIREIKLELEQKGVNGEFYAGNSAESFRTIDLIVAILKELKEKADKQAEKLGVPVDGVVLGVPVQIPDGYKKIMQDALLEAGFYKSTNEAMDKTEFVSEPVAVAVNYGLDLKSDKTVMVFDFGGGTLDLAVMNLKIQISRDKLHPHETKSKARLTLGGEKLTKLFFLNGFIRKYGIDEIIEAFSADYDVDAEELWNYLGSTEVGGEFIDSIDDLKCDLSYEKIVEYSFSGSGGIVLQTKKFYREDFERSIESVLQDIEEKIDECLDSKEGRIETYDIDSVILAGGSSLIPCIQTILTDKFGIKKVKAKEDNILEGFFAALKTGRSIVKESEVLTSVVRGLAAIGCKDKENETKLVDIVDSNYGIWNSEGRNVSVILEKGTRVIDTAYDKHAVAGGCNRNFHSGIENPSIIDVEVFQSDEQGDRKLGTICINNPGSGKYKIFMHVDPKKGWLIVDIYDRRHMRWYDDIPLDDRIFNIF